MLFLTPSVLAMPPAIAASPHTTRAQGTVPAPALPTPSPGAPQGTAAAIETVTLTPSDDVWVYPHATDPGRDEAMRVWGAGGRSVAADAADAEEFSYGYLRFVLPKSLRGRPLLGATLIVTNVPNDALDADEIAGTPIEARPLVGAFTEKGWIYSGVGKTYPDAKVRYGVGKASPTKGQPIEIRIELTPNADNIVGPTPFHAAFAKALAKPDADGEIGIALTSGVDVANVGMSAIYKLGTKDASDPARRPRLLLDFLPKS